MNISRRQLILSSAAGLLGSHALTDKLAFAQTPSKKKFIFIFLRGGVDGLAWVPPHGDRYYERVRGELAFGNPANPSNLINLDGFFGLNPAMDGVAQLFRRKHAAIFHAIASPYRDRSHFDAQDIIENGTGAARGSYSGWLNRVVHASGGKISATSLSKTMPLILSGRAEIGTWSPKQRSRKGKDYDDAITGLYAEDSELGNMLQKGLEMERMADKAMRADQGASKRAAGAGNFGRMISQAANMMNSPDGPNMSFIEVGGWDTHANQGTTAGALFNRLNQIDTGLSELPNMLGKSWQDTAVLVTTEFGRTAHPNGTGGTDHGTATAMLLLGGRINGGQVISQWPSLRERKLYQNRDLAPTMDTRSVFKAVVHDHLGLASHIIEEDIFPDSRNIRMAKYLFL